MQIQINTDHNIEGREAFNRHVAEVVQDGLSRFSEHITRVEVHLSDANGGKSGPNDKGCVIEARLEGRPPVAATDHADTLHQCVGGAAQKLSRLLESSLGRVERSAKPGPKP